MNSHSLGSGESKLETIISYILAIGVAVSLTLEIIGITLYYSSFGNLQVSQDKSVFVGGQNFFAFIIDQTQHLFGIQNALLYITMGLIILILTPYIRAITSAIYFASEKHYKYFLITLFVIIVLTLSLALH